MLLTNFCKLQINKNEPTKTTPELRTVGVARLY